MSISTRQVMAKLIGTDQFNEEEEAEINASQPEQLLKKINYVNFESKEQEKEVLDDLRTHHIPEFIYAFTGKEYIHPRLMITAAIHFHDYEKSVEEGHPDEVELYIACTGGYLDALMIIAEHKIAKIEATAEEERKPEIDALLAHLDRLVALYWTVGCIYATQLVHQLANLYPEESVEAQYYYEKAAIYFFFGKELMNEKQSLELAERMYPGEGYKACGWRSIDEASTEVFSHIPRVKYDSLFKTATEELSNRIGPAIQPLFDLQTRLSERLNNK